MRSIPLVAQQREDSAEQARAAAFVLAERAPRLLAHPAAGVGGTPRASVRLLIDKVDQGEAALFAPDAALALKQAEGDVPRGRRDPAWLRAGAAAGLHVGGVDTREMFVQRRIVVGVPGDSRWAMRWPHAGLFPASAGGSPRVGDHGDRGRLSAGVSRHGTGWSRASGADLRQGKRSPPSLRGCFKPVEGGWGPARPDDVFTREPALFPLPRSARLQAQLARGEKTGAIMALAYSGMRGRGASIRPSGRCRGGLASQGVT
jgi:hypothetical protein